MAFFTLFPLKSLSAAAFCGALLAACGAAGSDTQISGEAAQVKSGKTVAAKVNGSPIYHSDVTDMALVTGQVQQGEVLEASNPAYDQILSDLVSQRLLSAKAAATGLDKTPDAVHRINMAKERILANMIIEARLEKTVTDDAAKALYTQQIKLRQTGQEARASHILVGSEKEALAVKKRLDAGEDFAALASELSTDRGSRASGGDLGWFQADAMVAEFSKAVFALETAGVSAPFESQFGWHVAMLVGKRAAPVPEFETMEPELKNYLTLTEIDTLISELRAEAIIEKTASPAVETAPGDDMTATEEDANNE